ncbi:hypothetical protein OESDEN_14632 [Oesophagostomum dentatum]|uniref:Uncharacterized protein n=1 Tax=Oesophagostomum dentatum TaxID=61180 RepID=A0A0B1SQ86_OESDE|nr:hypothetical protein OESDEN_14632 [Oesophagostomum dentatum]
MATRKAWALPLVPAYFDVLRYYQYLTKTRLIESSLDSYFSGLVPPTASLEKSVQESLGAILESDRFDSEDQRISAVLACIFDEAIFSVAHNVPRLGDYRVAYDVQSECFWIRSGFMFLYDVKEIGSNKVVRKVRKTPKYIGDDRRKLGELAFVSRDQLAVQLRSREPLSPLHSLESDEACQPLFPEGTDIDTEILFSPKVMNLWPDENPLWQCPGYFVESDVPDETHTYGRIGAKSLSLLDERCNYWAPPGEVTPEERAELWQECAKAQAVASLFTTLCAQAHTHGFTQFTDITRPFTSQMMLSNGIDFVFAVGQLNTLAINIECDGFENPKTNVCQVEAPIRLYDAYRDGRFYHITPEGEKEGLNSKLPCRFFFVLLGDLMDEGQWGDYATFHRYADRFESLFGSNSDKPEIHVLAGNHDLGFHYAISPFRVDWFEKRFNSSTVDTVFIRGEEEFVFLLHFLLSRKYLFSLFIEIVAPRVT